MSKMRHRLLDKSVRAVTVLSSWCKFPRVIPQEELAIAFGDKHKCPKGKGNSADAIVTPNNGDEEEIIVVE